MTWKMCLLASILVLCLGFACGQDATSAAPKDPPVTLSPWVLHSKLIHEVPPECPVFIRDSQPQDVLIDVVVDENGKVQEANWVVCASCSVLLGQAMVRAVKQWEYQPTLLNGKAVSVVSWVAFRFRPEEEPSVEILTKSQSSTPAAEPPREPRPKLLPKLLPQRLRISSGVAETNLVQKVEPEYPRMAKIAHVQGDVVIECIIGKQGVLDEARIVSGHPLLAQSALDAVIQWRYKPYLLNGEPVKVETLITIRFHM